MNLSEIINKLVEVKAQRTELAKKDEDLGKQIATLERDLMHAMNEAGTMKAASDLGHSVSMSKNKHPTITDWDKFYAYVTTTNSFDLLHKRLSSTAFKDRWEAGEEIPGSSIAEIWGISITKSRK